MPALTRRSRILLGIAVAVVAVLLVGPRFIDTYVDWLWFGELGYRSVFTTVLFTRLVVFLVTACVFGAIVYAAWCWPTAPARCSSRPPAPTTRWPAAGWPSWASCGPSAWASPNRRRARRAGGPELLAAGAAVPARRQLRHRRPAVRQGPRLRLPAAVLPAAAELLFVALFLAFLANLVTHYIFGGIRLSAGVGAVSRAARIQLISLLGVLVLLKAAAYWLDRYELLQPHPAGQAVHWRLH